MQLIHPKRNSSKYACHSIKSRYTEIFKQIWMTVNLVLWVNDRKTAKAFNAALLEMQKRLQ